VTKEIKPSSLGEVAKVYEPKPAEASVLTTYFERQDARVNRPNVKVSSAGTKISVRADHPSEAIGHLLLMRALGTDDLHFANALLTQIANASGQGAVPDEATLNFLLSVIDGIAPRDQTEALLAAQMAVVHSAFMTFARRLAHVETVIQQDAAERAFNKLARTFAMQMETLKRYRTGGEQKVTVQHVHVNEGGQAIVGNVAPMAAGGGGPEILAPTP